MSQNERGTMAAVSLYCPTCADWTPAGSVQSVEGSSWCSVCGTELPWTAESRLDEALWASTPSSTSAEYDLESADPARRGGEAHAAFGRDARGRPLVPFGGAGAPLAPFDPEVDDLPVRVARLQEWLAKARLPIPAAFLRAFAVCDSASEVRCAWEIVRDQPWVLAGDHSFSDGAYVLTLQASLLDYRADMLITGPDLGRGVLLEVDGPTHRLANRVRRDLTRTARLARDGYRVVRVGTQEAAAFGRRVRVALSMDRLLPRPDALGPMSLVPTAPARARRWPATDTGYSVADIPVGERRTMVVEWLTQRRLFKPDLVEDARYEALLDLLARCERGAEVVFVHELLLLPWWQPHDGGSFDDGYDRLEIGRVVGGVRVPVVLEPLPGDPEEGLVGGLEETSEPAAEASVDRRPLALLIERPRHHGALTWEAERARRVVLEAAGYDLRRVAAEEIREELDRWQRSSMRRHDDGIWDLPARLQLERA